VNYCTTWTRDLKAIRLIMLFREEIVHQRRFESAGFTSWKNPATHLKIAVVSNVSSTSCTSVRKCKMKYVKTTRCREYSWVTEQSRWNWKYDYFATQLHWKPLLYFATQLHWKPLLYFATQLHWKPLLSFTTQLHWKPLLYFATQLHWKPLLYFATQLHWKPLLYFATQLHWKPLLSRETQH